MKNFGNRDDQKNVIQTEEKIPFRKKTFKQTYRVSGNLQKI